MPTSLEVGGFVDSDFSLLLFMSISSLSIFAMLIAGWSANSKYTLLGSVRAVAQFITYEVFFSLLFLPLLMLSLSGNILTVVERQAETSMVWALFPLFIVFYITMLVETNRSPFDMPEAEAELVAGFNVEYSSVTFAFFFLAEYNSMIISSILMVLLFFSGPGFILFLPVSMTSVSAFAYVSELYIVLFVLKVLFFCYSFVFVRANFPRVRYDQLLLLGWKVCLPLSLGFVYIFVFTILTFCSIQLYL